MTCKMCLQNVSLKSESFNLIAWGVSRWWKISMRGDEIPPPPPPPHPPPSTLHPPLKLNCLNITNGNVVTACAWSKILCSESLNNFSKSLCVSYQTKRGLGSNSVFIRMVMWMVILSQLLLYQRFSAQKIWISFRESLCVSYKVKRDTGVS